MACIVGGEGRAITPARAGGAVRRVCSAALQGGAVVPRGGRRYIEGMNTTTATSFASRGVERVVRGQAASDGDGVKLTRVLTQPLQRRLDPFLMLDAFGSDAASDYVGGFPDHPHRGFETVTIMLEGRMRHRDSVGNVGLLEPGSVQWMTAGRGIIHSEMPEQEAGRMAGFQLWVNLAAADKMTRAGVPRHRARRACPCSTLPTARTVRVIAGASHGTAGAVTRPTTEPIVLDLALPPGRAFDAEIPAGHNAFAYVFARRRSRSAAPASTRSSSSAWRSSPTRPAAMAFAWRRRERPSRRGCCWSRAGRSASRSPSTGRS